MSDPRAMGFNYGRGWGAAAKPPLYHRASQLARRLGREAAQKSAQAWTVEIALRNVRMATTGVEKAKALAGLSAALQAIESASD